MRLEIRIDWDDRGSYPRNWVKPVRKISHLFESQENSTNCTHTDKLRKVRRNRFNSANKNNFKRGYTRQSEGKIISARSRNK